MKIAIVHEMFVKFWWAEQVVKNISEIYPEADIFTLLYDEKKIWKHFPKNKIHDSCFSLPSQKIYSFTKRPRLSLPWMAQSVETLDLSAYDVVLVSSSWFAHGVITKPDTQCIVYYHSPARYLWDWTNELKKSIHAHKWFKSLLCNSLFLKLRQWDYMAAQRVDTRIANSYNVAKRIKKYYRQEAEVLYPPIDTQRFSSDTHTTWDYYIIISALTEFKNIQVAITSFNRMPDKKLVIIGAGDYRKSLENISESSNISFTWPQYWDNLVHLVQSSAGLVFPWEEDFGIVPIEVMAAGKPVFAYRGGGLTETVLEWLTWEFFDNIRGEDFVEKFRIFDTKNISWAYSSETCVNQAKIFDKNIFEEGLRKLISK